MNKINDISNISKNLLDKTSKLNKENVKNIQEITNIEADAAVSYTKTKLTVEHAEKVANNFKDSVSKESSKALDASLGNIDEARIRALLED